MDDSIGCHHLCPEQSHVLFQETVHVQPVDKGVKPGVAGAVRIAEAEAVAAILVEVKLDRDARFIPGFDQAKLTAEQEVIGRDGGKHGWSILGNFDWAHAAIDRADEGE